MKNYDNMVKCLDILKRLQATRSSEQEQILIQPRQPDFEIAYSMEPLGQRAPERDLKLPNIEKYVKMLPSATSTT